MDIRIFKEYQLNEKPEQVRPCEVNLGTFGTGMLFAYSKSPNTDPCESMLYFHKYPMQLALFGESGQMLWHKVLGMGVVPGIWTMPFVAFDLNQDGVDEIYYVGNDNEEHPLDNHSMTLEVLDALDGSSIGHYHFEAENLEWERLGHAFRFMLFGGYVDGEPVLVAAQGTYGDIYLQAYGSDMNVRWRRVIKKEDGSCGSHDTFVFDFNKDGIDEVLYGEHMISLKDGTDVMCFDRDRYFGHSDIVLPFQDPATKKMYLYTCRESGDYDGCPRVVTFDMQTGKPVWEDIYSDEWGHYIDDGHMHCGWVATVRSMPQTDAPGKLAYAQRRRNKKKLVEHYVYDAITGEKVEYPFPYPFADLRPIDINGDGYHEFLVIEEGRSRIMIIDSEGKNAFYIGGRFALIGKHYDYAGEQIMTFYPQEGVVRIWGDAAAKESLAFKERYSNGFLKTSMKAKGNGYNRSVSIDCAF